MTAPRPQPSTERVAKVQSAIRTWKSQLVDLGGRNTLLYYRDQKVGTLDLARGEPTAVAALLAGRSVRISTLFPEEAAQADAIKRCRTIYRKSREFFEERGIQTLLVATGFATWRNEKTASPPRAPVLLAPAALTARGAALEDFDLALTGDMEINPTLVHLLSTEFGRTYDTEALLAQTDGTIDTEAELQLVLDWLRTRSAGIPGFVVTDGMVLGNFSYAKLPMVTDLDRSADALAAHEIIAAIAGDQAARDALNARYAGIEVSASDPDHTPPADEFLVIDADASQSYAINAVIKGQDLIIKGPPGTGKSQTIANLIATAVARGKTVLFVAEKRAAIEAVFKRLQSDETDLGDLLLDVHGGASKRREFAASLARSLDLASAIPLVSHDQEFATLTGLRSTLNGQVAATHTPSDPWGVSVYEARARAAGIPAAARSDLRFRGEVLRSMGATQHDAHRQTLRDFAEKGAFDRDVSGSPWSQVEVVSADQARTLYEVVDRLASVSLPRARTALLEAAAQTGLTVDGTLEGWAAAVAAWTAAADAVQVFGPGVFSPGLDQVLADFAPARGSWGSRFMASLTNGRYRTAKRTVRGYLRDGGTPDATAYAALSRAAEAAHYWGPRSVRGTLTVPANLEEVAASVHQCVQELGSDATLVSLLQPTGRPVDDLMARLVRLRADRAVLIKLPAIAEGWRGLARAGLSDLLHQIRLTGLEPGLAVDRLEHVWLHSIIEHVEFDDPRVGAFDAVQHDRIGSEFRTLDSQHISSTSGRIKRRYAERVVAARDKHPQQAMLVAQQAARRRGHLPVRSLFAQAPDVLLALKPCWAMSPLVVSQLLPSERRYFDLVVFDEASQVTPADAVPAILRGERLVVAGDDRQLPPTAFFASQAPDEERDEDEIDLAATSGFESVLDSLTAILRQRMLVWHYRSRDERLIAFSNLQFYDRSLTTFPGTIGECLDHVLVPFEGGAGQEKSVDREVNRVVELVLERAATHPHQTLGVIAMGITHANKVDEAIRKALESRPDLEEFFSEKRSEPFFVKNLERVQGDERDAIILTIGYGKTADGRMLYRFGPLNMEGGERRLNVAVTRARQHMTVVSSFRSSEIDPDRTSARGVLLLKDYLRYAETHGSDLGDSRLAPPPLNPFEIQIRDALVAAGLKVKPQHGASGYRIDFAVEHPDRPGVYVMAIECDGASYHSSPTARDRDRLRQQHLERLDWRFHRIWSGDWFGNRERALKAALVAYREALEAYDQRRLRAPRPGSPRRIRSRSRRLRYQLRPISRRLRS